MAKTAVRYILQMLSTDAKFVKQFSQDRAAVLKGVRLTKAERHALTIMDLDEFLKSIKHLKKIVALAGVDETV